MQQAEREKTAENTYLLDLDSKSTKWSRKSTRNIPYSAYMLYPSVLTYRLFVSLHSDPTLQLFDIKCLLDMKAEQMQMWERMHDESGEAEEKWVREWEKLPGWVSASQMQTSGRQVENIGSNCWVGEVHWQSEAYLQQSCWLAAVFFLQQRKAAYDFCLIFTHARHLPTSSHTFKHPHR